MSPLEEGNDKVGIVQRYDDTNAAISHKSDAAGISFGIEPIWLSPLCDRGGLCGSDADLSHPILGVA